MLIISNIRQMSITAASRELVSKQFKTYSTMLIRTNEQSYVKEVGCKKSVFAEGIDSGKM